MNAWYGFMDWPLDRDWQCETCDERWPLIWGITHGTCRCDKCHTEYRMRDEGGTVVTRPICRLKEEYRRPARWAWKKWGRPISDLHDLEWDKAIYAVEDENASA